MSNDQLIEKAADIIFQSKNVVVFTGAGISTESGIPDFRGKDGIWKKYDPYEFGSYEVYLNNSEKYWTMRKEFYSSISDVEPNAAHYAIADLEHQYNKVFAVITQNIDHLHQMAGSSKVHELHGTYRTSRCLDCGKKFTFEYILTELKNDKIPIKCDCGGLVKPNTILFGEPLPKKPFSDASKDIRKCDCFIVIGSTLLVNPAAGMPLLAAKYGAKVIIINMEPTRMDHVAEVVVQGKAGEILPAIISKLSEFIKEGHVVEQIPDKTEKMDIVKRVKRDLLNDNISKKITSEENSQTAMHYFSTSDYLTLQIDEGKVQLSESEIKKVKENRKTLYEFREQIISTLNLRDSLDTYSEGFVLGALTSAIRDNEASVDDYDLYVNLVEEFKQWPEIGFSSIFFQKSWEEVNNTIEEIKGWMESKKEEYFPIFEKIIKLKIQNEEEYLARYLEHLMEKEVFYIISNTLMTNPLLNGLVKRFIETQDDLNYKSFEEKQVKVLKILYQKATDEKAKRMIELFLNHPRISRITG